MHGTQKNSPRRSSFNAAARMILALAAPAGSALAGKYNFTRIADTTGPIADFNLSYPTLNNAGTVAFAARMDDGRRVIFTGNGGPLTTIVDEAGPLTLSPVFAIGSFIDEAGQVPFHARYDDDSNQGVFVGGGGPLTFLAGTSSGYDPTYPAINRAGLVVFGGNRQDGDPFPARGVYAVPAAGGTPGTLIEYGNGGWCPAVSFETTDMNNAGAVAALGIQCGVNGIYRIDGGEVTPLAVEGGMFSALGNNWPVINDLGDVVFRGYLTGGGEGIFLITGGGQLVTVADSSGPFNRFADFTPDYGCEGPTVNNYGVVVFTATLDESGYHGIFRGPDPVRDKIIQQGDLLDGAAVMALKVVPRGLNDQGAVAFWAALSDGRMGVYRADLARRAAGQLQQPQRP